MTSLWVNKWYISSSFFFSRISFDFTCYTEAKLFRELTGKPTGSFSFLACTLISLNLIHLLCSPFILSTSPNERLLHKCRSCVIATSLVACNKINSLFFFSRYRTSTLLDTPANRLQRARRNCASCSAGFCCER